QREFTGFKYYRSSHGSAQKEVYDRRSGLEAAAEHADHFVEARRKQILNLTDNFKRPPILVCPYDAELFGHWWYEGPEFLDGVVRRACADNCFAMITPEDYLG